MMADNYHHGGVETMIDYSDITGGERRPSNTAFQKIHVASCSSVFQALRVVARVLAKGYQQIKK